MSIDFHLDSVREVATEVVALPAADGAHHYKAQKGEYVLYIGLPANFPTSPPRMTTFTGLPLYNEAEWRPTFLLGEEVRRVFAVLEKLWGNLKPSSVDYGTLKRLAAGCTDVDSLLHDAISRKTLLIGNVATAADVAEGSSKSLTELEDSLAKVDLLVATVTELNATCESLKSKCGAPKTQFPKGMGTKDGVRTSLLNLHDEKSKIVENMEADAMQSTRDQRQFDSELTKLLAAYKDLHMLELQAKLVRSL